MQGQWIVHIFCNDSAGILCHQCRSRRVISREIIWLFLQVWYGLQPVPWTAVGLSWPKWYQLRSAATTLEGSDAPSCRVRPPYLLLKHFGHTSKEASWSNWPSLDCTGIGRACFPLDHIGLHTVCRPVISRARHSTNTSCLMSSGVSTWRLNQRSKFH